MANVESTLSHESSPPEPVDDNPSTPIAALGRIWKQLLAQWGTDNTEPERSGALDEAMWMVRFAISWLPPLSAEDRAICRSALDVFHDFEDEGLEYAVAAGRLRAVLVATAAPAA